MKRRALLSLLFLGVAACTAGNRASDSSSAACCWTEAPLLSMRGVCPMPGRSKAMTR